MLKVHYYEGMNSWQAPEIMPFENIVLHPAAKVLHYAVEVFIFCISKMTCEIVLKKFIYFY